MTSNTTPMDFKLSAASLLNLSAALNQIAREMPARTTARQAAAFLTLAYARAMGREINLTELVELGGSRADGKANYGDSPARVLEPFRIPDEAQPDRAGWVETVEDVHDKRRKNIYLTDEGLRIARKIISVIEG